VSRGGYDPRESFGLTRTVAQAIRGVDRLSEPEPPRRQSHLLPDTGATNSHTGVPQVLPLQSNRTTREAIAVGSFMGTQLSNARDAGVRPIGATRGHFPAKESGQEPWGLRSLGRRNEEKGAGLER
jgi:hypothetical protein